MSELKPCPFCGSIRIIKGERYFAMCVDCGATGPEKVRENTPEKKWKADWNCRSQQAADQRDIDNQLVEDLSNYSKQLERKITTLEAALRECVELQEQALHYLGDAGNGSKHDPSWIRPVIMTGPEMRGACQQAYHLIHAAQDKLREALR